MFSQPRIHIARIAPISVDAFTALFAACMEAARTRLTQQHIDLACLWDFAQYLDLVDAGFGKKSDSMYRVILGRVRLHLEAHGASPAVRALCARTGALADLLVRQLDQAEAQYDADPTLLQAAAA